MSGAVQCAHCSVAVRVRAPGRSLEPSTAIYGLQKSVPWLHVVPWSHGTRHDALSVAPRPRAAAPLLVGEPQAALVDEPLEVPAVLADERDGALVEAIEIHGAHERGVGLRLAFLEAIASTMRVGDNSLRCDVAFGRI